MATNIFESLKSEFSDEIIGQLGKFVGEDSSKTKSALSPVFAALLGGLASKSSTTQGSTDIMNMITEGGFGADTLKGLSNAFAGGDATKNLLQVGTNFLSRIFGDKVSQVVDWICSSSGVGKSSASSLLGLVVPAVLGFLGKEVKGSNLSASGLTNLLSGQADFLKNAAPAGLAGVLGLSNLADLSKSDFSGVVANSVQKKSSIWKWLLPLLIIAAIVLLLLRMCSVSPVEKAAEKAGKVSEMLGKYLMVKLPNGVEINVPEFGVEKKLIAFIEDKSRPVDKKTWFSFDRLEFETGSAKLKPSSMEQLKNIAEIMKAYPQVTLKIGGYTDNTGAADVNLKLSQQRAANTMDEIIKSGIDAKRLEAEGYGEQYPVADNATEEGRAKNRRIDILVTGK